MFAWFGMGGRGTRREKRTRDTGPGTDPAPGHRNRRRGDERLESGGRVEGTGWGN